MSGAVIARAIAELETVSWFRPLTDVESRRLERLVRLGARRRRRRATHRHYVALCSTCRRRFDDPCAAACTFAGCALAHRRPS